MEKKMIEANNTTTRVVKQIFRKYFKTQLASLQPTMISRESRQITTMILEGEEFYKTCTHVCCYLPMLSGAEVNTMDIIVESLRKKKDVFVPVLGDNDDMVMLRIRDESDLATFEVKTKYKLLEPPAFSLPHRVNLLDTLSGECKILVIVPGLAFDYKLQRLGRGKGYYDKFFAQLQSLKQEKQFQTYYVGVCFANQYIDENFTFPQEVLKELEQQTQHLCNSSWVIPTTSHDIAMDKVIYASFKSTN